MRLFEISDSPYRDNTLPLSNYRGLYNPRDDKLSSYGKEYKDAALLWDEIDDMMEEGVTPKVINVSISTLLATQDWVSSDPGDGPMWEELGDHPVVLDKDNQRYILDGHNRIARAKAAGKQNIQCYYFVAMN